MYYVVNLNCKFTCYVENNEYEEKIMYRLITEAYNFINNCNLSYAFCGGYAFELFANKSYRRHSDLDITLFNESRKEIIDYIVDKGWHIYEHLHSKNCLRRIMNANDDGIQNCLYIWAIKPGCSFIKIQSNSDAHDCYAFKIMDSEQKKFDFIDITFNPRKDDNFVCSVKNNITREISKATIYHGQIPYLAPEVILFFVSNPAYIESDYHRAKTNLDYKTIPPLLSEESMNWLITSIKKEYPQGNIRLEQLKKLKDKFYF